MKRTIVMGVIVLALVLSACSSTATSIPQVEVVGRQVAVAGGTYTDVSPAELNTMLAHKDFTLVNVHIPDEGKIAGTYLSVPYDQVAQNLDQLPAKAARIVLYCRSGRMSAIAAANLVELGYTNVWNLDGGMAAWEQAGLEINR